MFFQLEKRIIVGNPWKSGWLIAASCQKFGGVGQPVMPPGLPKVRLGLSYMGGFHRLLFRSYSCFTASFSFGKSDDRHAQLCEEVFGTTVTLPGA
jgi:hypothetical protein